MYIKIIAINLRCRDGIWIVRDDDQKYIDQFCSEHNVLRTQLTPTESNTMFLLTLEYIDISPITPMESLVSIIDGTVPNSNKHENNSKPEPSCCFSKY